VTAPPPFVRIPGGGSPERQELTQPWPRTRPGERPVWVDLCFDKAELREWRARASSHGLSVDVWLALLIEHGIVRTRVTAVDDTFWESVIRASERALGESRLAPTDELRRWLAVLSGSDDLRADDLPSLVLPARLLAQLPHERRAAIVRSAAVSGAEPEALLLERAAAVCGQTLEAWAYLAALNSRRR
jgi:hypothetical protein